MLVTGTTYERHHWHTIFQVLLQFLESIHIVQARDICSASLSENRVVPRIGVFSEYSAYHHCTTTISVRIWTARFITPLDLRSYRMLLLTSRWWYCIVHPMVHVTLLADYDHLLTGGYPPVINAIRSNPSLFIDRTPGAESPPPNIPPFYLGLD